jgi:uncharacterized delta-60 repeat protein
LDTFGFPEGTSTFNPGTAVTNGAVYSIFLQTNGKILIGGSFTAPPGVGRSFLARLETNGVLESASTFNPGTGPSGPVRSLAVHAGGKILIGGEFGAVNGVQRGRIARLNPDGTLEPTTTFNTGVGVTGIVRSLVPQSDGKILVGGSFGTVNNQPRVCLARLQPDGSVESTATFDPGSLNNTVMSIALQADGKIVLGDNSTGLVLMRHIVASRG